MIKMTSNVSNLFLLIVTTILSYFFSINESKTFSSSIDEDLIDTIKISAVGDLMCHTPQIKDAKQSDGSLDFSHMFEFVKPILEKSDLTVGNLETVFAGSEQKFSGYPLFNSPDEFALAIQKAGFDVLVTSNNHSLDREFYGLERTIKILDSLGIKHCGTYITQEDSEQILILEIKSLKLALLSYTYGTNGIPKPKGKEFCVSTIDTSKIKSDIQKAKQQNPDKIIVYLHWGNEYQRNPNQSQKKLAEFLFHNGVDIILGSHPHVIQPSDIKIINDTTGKEKKVFVIYSMGNFISNQRKKFTDSGVIVHLSLIKNLSINETLIDTIYFTPTYVSKLNGRFRIIPVKKALQKFEINDSLWTNLFSSEDKKLRQILIDFENHIWIK